MRGDGLACYHGGSSVRDSDVALPGGPCPVCSGEVKQWVCQDCGWDEFGGNVAFKVDEERYGDRKKARTAHAQKAKQAARDRRRRIWEGQ